MNECQTKSAQVFAILQGCAQQDSSNDTPQPVWKFTEKAYPGYTVKETCIYKYWGIVGIVLMSPFSWQAFA